MITSVLLRGIPKKITFNVNLPLPKASLKCIICKEVDLYMIIKFWKFIPCEVLFFFHSNDMHHLQ